MHFSWEGFLYINIPYRNVYQRTWKLVDCKIYNFSTSHSWDRYRFCNPPTFRSFDYTIPIWRKRKLNFTMLVGQIQSQKFIDLWFMDWLLHKLKVWKSILIWFAPQECQNLFHNKCQTLFTFANIDFLLCHRRRNAGDSLDQGLKNSNLCLFLYWEEIR